MWPEEEQVTDLTGVLWGFPFTLAAMLGKHPELLGGKALEECERQRAEDPTTGRVLQNPLPQPQGGEMPPNTYTRTLGC